ncbi:MAG: UDP-4-amino-4,6-dideoxy-N-acetyl-beta-L-altrosamine transaminase, partial [Candidatus Zixiibacteriota bacterium]
RLSDIHAALGLSQLSRLEQSIERRQEIAQLYRKLIGKEFAPGEVSVLTNRDCSVNAYHLFVVQIDFKRFGVSRAKVMNWLRGKGIGTQVHYIPVHLQPYYRGKYHTKPGDFPNAEDYYQKALSLPMYPGLTDRDIERVVVALAKSLKGNL